MAEVNMEGASADHPAAMSGGPPPPSISHSGSGHPSPGHPSPPYLAARPAKHPAPHGHYQHPGGYYGGHGGAPAGYHAPPESRYPPSTARHDEYQRHPPPPAHGYPHGYHHTAGPPSGAAAVIKPHPADRFGKTITVSGRSDIHDPPAGAPHAPATVHSPRGAHGAPVAHFSPSRGGAFRPYLKPDATAASSGRRPPEIVEGGSSELETDEEVRAATEKGGDGTDEESKEGSKEGTKEAGGEDGAQDRGMKSVTHSSSMDTSEPKEAHAGKEAAAAARGEGKGEFERLKPAPISTKRPRSRNGPEASVDDDTPKHVNVRPAGFQYPTKRSKLSDESRYAPPPSGYEEGRQDHSHGRQLSKAPSAHSLEIRDSWLHPGEKTPTEYPEPASYLPTGSMSWEVPAGTLSAIGSTLSFGNAAGGGGGVSGQGPGGFLAPRPSAHSKLFEPPPLAAPRGGREERTLEARGAPAGAAAREGARDKYAPATVHDPRRAHQYHQERRDPYGDARYGGCERRDAYESPGRHGHEHGSEYPQPWTSPPRSHAPPLPPLHDTSHHALGTPGGLSLGAGSFESKGSFRSLEEPMDLLCRASFSWETGLPGAAPSGYGHPPGGPGGHQRQPSGPHGGYAGYGPPLPAPSGYHAPPFPHHAPQDPAVHLSHQQKILRALALRNELRTIGDPASPHQGLLLLLALPHDRHCLSETLCIVRNNIEVFTATLEDVNAPAPGRKRPIQLGQVGLRCVYCRMAPPKSRIKRATCFPSSVKRIYRAVIDMKLDHFRHCPHVPDGLKARLDELKQGSTRSTGTTVQYFVRGAEEMGMRDNGEDGVGIDLRRVRASGPEVQAGPMAPHARPVPPKGPVRARPNGPPGGPPQSYGPTASFHSAPAFQAANAALGHPGVHPPNVPPPRRYSGRALLSLPSDSSVLSPLRCFLRKHVVAFAATDSDASIRSPSTFAVRPGQVGVGCVHCLAADPKARSNRAVCFPFSMSRIYQSVADIQRFHLGECRALPAQVREEFRQLQKESAKGSKGLATRSYWIESARRIGLADGPNGMYFCRDPSLPPRPEPRGPALGGGDNLGLLAQAASGEDSLGQRPLVTPDDRPTIAAFLYRVMEQLRPTRFSEADRNKRRSKDVGSIGVECRHCAGKIDGRKFFWSSVSAAESNFVSVHSHVLGCPHVPLELREELAGLKELRREQTSRLRVGSQKAFFERVWARLHGLPVPPIESAGKGGKKKKGSSKKKKAAKAKAPDDGALDLQQTNSEEVRAILESKSTLSSMPSLDESVTAFPSELTARGDEVAEKKIVSQGSKGSLSTVARDMSAVSVRCAEEEETGDDGAKIAEV
ncbi:hypothetical protein ACHAXT_007736 [Thalassiosira profunda]